MRDNIKEYEAVTKAAENFARSVAEGDNFKTRINVLAVEETVASVRVLEEGWDVWAVHQPSFWVRFVLRSISTSGIGHNSCRGW